MAVFFARYSSTEDSYAITNQFTQLVETSDPISKTRLHAFDVDANYVSLTVFFLQESGAFSYNSGKFIKVNPIPPIRSLGSTASAKELTGGILDLTLSDFDNVEVGSLFLQNTETILIYGGAKDSPNISQIRFDRDMSQSLFSLVEHKD